MDFTKGSILAPGTTIAGYPIFKGDGEWRIFEVNSSTANQTGNSASFTGSPSRLGWITLSQVESNGDWFANMQVLVSTQLAGGNVYVAGSPCGGTHMVTVSKGSGYDDNCLTIDANNFMSASRSITYFDLMITQTRSGGRRYLMKLQLNAEMLGFRETTLTDWNNAETLQLSPSRTAFVSKLKKWAELLQNASGSILNYSKPQTVFDDIPSYRTLLPVPDDLKDNGFSQYFISAVESTRNKPTFRAIAYTKLEPGLTKWSNQYARESQAVADKDALENCDKGRASNSEPCKLYKLD